MLQKLLDAGAPIDAIGAQGHDVYEIGAAKSKTCAFREIEPNIVALLQPDRGGP